MLNEQTIDKMQEMRLFGMAQLFREIMGKPQHADLSHEEFVGLLMDAELTTRQDKRLNRLLRDAHLKQQACLEDIDYKHTRGLHKQILLGLANCSWITNRQNVLISGPTGVGKTYIACALGNAVCRAGYKTLYIRAPKLFTTLYQSQADGSYLKYLAKLAKMDLLIIDDLGLTPMGDTERKDFMEVVEDRNLTGSMIVASQVPVKNWYEIIGDPTIADAICDRLLHHAYKIELSGESMRKTNLETDKRKKI